MDARAYWSWKVDAPVKERFVGKVRDIYSDVREEMERAEREPTKADIHEAPRITSVG